MAAIRGKIVVDDKKFIIQIGGDTANSADFREMEMNLIAIGPGMNAIEAILRDDTNSIICRMSFSDRIELSGNMLNKNLSIEIDGQGVTPLSSAVIFQFSQVLWNKHKIQETRDWSTI